MNIGGITNRIKSALPWTKQEPQLTRDQAMEARPIRNPSLRWRENEDGHAVVVLPRRSDWIGKLLSWFFMVPQSRPIVLSDEVATFVWVHCDGSHTVKEISEMLGEKYKLGKREAELSLTTFLKQLGKRGMVGMMVSEEMAEQLGDRERSLLGLDEIEATPEELERARAKGEGGKSGSEGG